MKGFQLDENGDLLIENNEISIVTGDELLKQKVVTVLKTNLKEWFFDWEQGVDFENLLGKNTNGELTKYEILRGLHQVDSSFTITEYDYSVDKLTRKAMVFFKAITDSGQEVGGEVNWG